MLILGLWRSVPLYCTVVTVRFTYLLTYFFLSFFLSYLLTYLRTYLLSVGL